MAYALADKPYADVLHSFADAASAVTGKNPFKQFPFVETSGGVIYQTLAIMHHVGRGTPVWPDDAGALTRALEVGMAAYDLYQHFGGFPADDAAAKKKFEERRAPQFFAGLGEVYAQQPFAAGEAPSFADCMTHAAVLWCSRRNDVCRGLLQSTPALGEFMTRFEAVPAIHAFMARQAEARAKDNSV